MKKCYNDEKIWKNILEELSEFDIDDGLFYKLDEYGFTFIDNDDFEYHDAFKIIQDLFYYETYDNIQGYELSAILDISDYIKNNNLYRDMIVARGNLNEYLFKTFEPDDEEISKLSNDFEFKAEIYLWTKHIFTAVVSRIEKLLNDCSDVIELANDAIRRN